FGLNPVMVGQQGLINIAARIPLPGVGALQGLSLLTLIGMAACFLIYFNKQNAGERGKGMTRSAAVIAIPGVAVLSSLPLLALVVMAVAVVVVFFFKKNKGGRPRGRRVFCASLLLHIVTNPPPFFPNQTLKNHAPPRRP